MASDYYPKTDGAKLAFLDNLVAYINSVAATVGLTPADVTAIGTARNNLRSAQQNKVAKKTAAQAAVAGAAAVDKSTEETIRSYIRRIKVNPGYTEAIGRQLGIESGGGVMAAASAGVGGGPRPDLEAASVVNGAVEITFIKNGFTGVEIECQRGAETAYSFLARDTEAPYVDTRANAGDGPETRRYRARYLRKDAVVGDYSDVLVVTVPGLA